MSLNPCTGEKKTQMLGVGPKPMRVLGRQFAMSKEKRCGSTGGWGRCYQRTLHTNKNQPAPSKNWCLIPKGLVFWHPNSHPFGTPWRVLMASFCCVFFFRYQKWQKQRGHLERNEKIADTTWNFKRLARKDTRSSREQQKHFTTVWHF